jgi:hypothetical protein
MEIQMQMMDSKLSTSGSGLVNNGAVDAVFIERQRQQITSLTM